MPTITPETRVHLLSVPLEKDMQNTLYFTSSSAQYGYFYGKAVKTNVDFTYQRKDNIIMVPYQVDSLYSVNYVMYQNHNFTDKWFYAFVDKMEYVDEGTTRLYITTDVIQTWLFDYTLKSCFVEREHVSNDVLGAHTVPEGLQLGDYVVNSHLMDSFNDDICIVVGSSEDYFNNYNMGVNIYSGLPAPLFYYRYNPNERVAFEEMLQALARDGKTDAIVSMFICPQWLAPRTGETKKVDETYTAQSEMLGISRITSLNGYTPKNKKLLTYPYCYIALSNANGQYQTYQQELWELTDNEMKLKLYGAITSGCSIRAVPQKYNGNENAWDDSITAGKFPALAWANDIYTNWLTQNGVNIGIGTLNAETSGVLGGGIRAIVGASESSASEIKAGFKNIWDSLQESYRKSIIPAGVNGSLNSGDVVTSAGVNRIHCYRVTIKQEFAKIIDNYFQMFGYLVNEVKVPDKNHMKYWWFTKTRGCVINGNIPEDDADRIRECYNNGIRFWKNVTVFESLNYNLNNRN